MRAPKTLSTAALALALAAAVAGCGGGGGEESTASAPREEAPPALSKAEFIARGDAICAEVNAAVGTVGEAEAGVASEVGQVADLYAGMVERLKALGEPREAAGYSPLIGSAVALARVEGEAKLAAERGETASLDEANERAQPALETFRSNASAFGFKECSKGPQAPTPSTNSGGAGAAEESETEAGVEAPPEAAAGGEVEEAAPEEAAPPTGGAGGAGIEAEGEGEAAPEEEAGGGSGGSSGGIGPG